MTTLRIGTIRSFERVSIEGSSALAVQQPLLDYLTLDCLTESSLADLALQKEQNPQQGYTKEFVDVVQALIPLWQNGGHLKVITNAGGLNPIACASACAEVLIRCSDRPIKIGVIHGDNVLFDLKSDVAAEHFSHLETGEPLSTIVDSLLTAHTYLGAKQIVEALRRGADIVIAGRVADPSLIVGPYVYHYGCSWMDLDEMAGATIAGRLIGQSRVSPALSSDKTNISPFTQPRGPFVELAADGSFIFSQRPETGKMATAQTVKALLREEIGTLGEYFSPDVTVSLLSVEVTDVDNQRVLVRGAKGRLPPATYQVSATYRAADTPAAQPMSLGPEGTRSRDTVGYSPESPASFRPLFGYWPCLIPCHLVHPHVNIFEVQPAARL